MAVATTAVATVVEVTTRDEGKEEEEDDDDDDEEEEVVMFPTNDEVGYGEQKPAFNTNCIRWEMSNLRFCYVSVYYKGQSSFNFMVLGGSNLTIGQGGW